MQLLASLRERDATELVFGTEEESEDSSDPMPKSSSRDTTFWTPPGKVTSTGSRDGQMTVREREKDSTSSPP